MESVNALVNSPPDLPPGKSIPVSCLTCQIANTPCDGTRPICSSCRVEADMMCAWPTSSAVPSRSGSVSGASPLLPPGTSMSRFWIHSSFDDPAVLRGSATSFIRADRSKQLFQYVCENGHLIVRNSVPLVEGLKNFNVLKLGFSMGRHYPGQMSAYLALGARHLSNTTGVSSHDAQTYYTSAVRYIRSALDHNPDGFPDEWMCATAAILSIYEMYNFVEPKVRMAHLLGYCRLVECRIRLAPNSWGPTRTLLEWYLYCFSTGCAFYRELLHDKTFNYTDDLILLLNEVPRPLGPEIGGVPSIFMSIAFKLAFICENPGGDKSWTQWIVQLFGIAQALETWQPDAHLLAYPNREKLFIAKLYHQACLVWTRKLLSPRTQPTDALFQDCVTSAVMLIEAYPPLLHPPVCIGWPLAILNMAVTDDTHKRILREPLENFVTYVTMVGFTALLEILDIIWGEGPGSPTYIGIDALFRTDLLRRIHL